MMMMLLIMLILLLLLMLVFGNTDADGDKYNHHHQTNASEPKAANNPRSRSHSLIPSRLQEAQLFTEKRTSLLTMKRTICA